MELRDDRVTRTVYATDNSIYQLMPKRVGLPEGASEIAALLHENYSTGSPQPIVARGGGTGTNGQSLTDATTIDLKRNMNRLLSLDVDAQTAVVQPGLVTAELNALVAPHGLFWPPHTSTLNRATIGGMISTDAAGKGSLVYGRAHRHVERLVMILDDGTEWIAEPVTEEEATRRAALDGRGAELWRALLGLDVETAAGRLGLPELARGFSGYGLDRFRGDGLVDPVALVCGAEGTLGILVEATISLSPVPDVVRLVVASYPTFGDALEDAVELRETAPAAIESFDETTLKRGRASPAWPALGEAIGDHHGAVLLLEYTGDAVDIDDIMTAIESTGRSHARHVIDDPHAQAQVWKVRADAVGLLAKVAVGGPDLSARPTAFVEDCAVPVAEMPAFIENFRRTLDDAGLTYGMFGHADVGCVHVRPAVDLTDPGQRQLIADITDKVTNLVASHGGIVWGEHGRGFRGANVDTVLPPDTVTLMRQIKTAFDPHDIFNPGKLYRPLGSDEPLLGVTDPSMRGQFDAEVAVEIRRTFDSAFACNGNGLCHHYAVDEAMCPSYKATGDPALSPKGRADLIRSWLRDDRPDTSFERQLAENLDQCLSCSACTGRCPVEVDIPELKSRFLEDYHDRTRRPLSHHLMSRFEQMARMGARVPRLAALGRKPVERLLGLVDLPAPQAPGRTAVPSFENGADFDVVVMPDVFTSTLEPRVLDQTVELLESVGYSTALGPFVASGKFDHVKGRRIQFEKAVTAQAALVRRIVAAGAIPVVIEPAVALLHGHEYPQMAAEYPAESVASLVDLLLDRSDRLASLPDRGSVLVAGHCTERATEPQLAAGWPELLRRVGYTVEAPELGCCGMAGVFGHEASNQQMSRSLWELSWQPALSSAVESRVVAPGYSCRSQARRFGGHTIEHPIALLGDRQAEQ